MADSVDGHKTQWIYWTPLKCTLQTDEFYVMWNIPLFFKCYKNFGPGARIQNPTS